MIGALLAVVLAAPPAWIHDDFAAAQARSRATGKPIVIDLWAPWCHTCLSMKSTVLEDPKVAGRAPDFVWLAADTDRPTNAELVKRYTPSFWPTFLVVDAAGTVHARHQGAASLNQFLAFLNAGTRGTTEALSAHERARRDGERQALAGQYAAAARTLQGAVETAPTNWTRRPDALVAWISALHKAKAWRACTDLGMARMDEAAAQRSASAADFAYFAAACADRLEPPDPVRTDWVRRLASRSIDRVLSAPKSGLSIDDRSDALRIQRTLHDALGDPVTARRLAITQRILLDRAAREAPGPAHVMTWAWPRAENAVYLKQPDRLIPDLEALTRALPEAYDPPYRLAWLLLEAGRPKDALPHAQTALARVYGPRKARVEKLIAKIKAAR